MLVRRSRASYLIESLGICSRSRAPLFQPCPILPTLSRPFGLLDETIWSTKRLNVCYVKPVYSVQCTVYNLLKLYTVYVCLPASRNCILYTYTRHNSAMIHKYLIYPPLQSRGLPGEYFNSSISTWKYYV